MIDRKKEAIELLKKDTVLGITLRTFNGNRYNVYHYTYDNTFGTDLRMDKKRQYSLSAKDLLDTMFKFIHEMGDIVTIVYEGI